MSLVQLIIIPTIKYIIETDQQFQMPLTLFLFGVS